MFFEFSFIYLRLLVYCFILCFFCMYCYLLYALVRVCCYIWVVLYNLVYINLTIIIKQVNSSGVMPIIFSTSSLALPGTLSRFTGLAALKKAALALNPGGKLLFYCYWYKLLERVHNLPLILFNIQSCILRAYKIY